MSVLDSSIAPDWSEPTPELFGAASVGGPEFVPTVYVPLPFCTSPWSLVKLARITWPSVSVAPLLKAPLTTPFGSTEKLVSVPGGTILRSQRERASLGGRRDARYPR